MKFLFTSLFLKKFLRCKESFDVHLRVKWMVEAFHEKQQELRVKRGVGRKGEGGEARARGQRQGTCSWGWIYQDLRSCSNPSSYNTNIAHVYIRPHFIFFGLINEKHRVSPAERGCACLSPSQKLLRPCESQQGVERGERDLWWVGG